MKKYIEETINLLKNSYSPYSKFKVACILKCKEEEKIYKGVNVENLGIQSICAERSAFVNALSDGKRTFEFAVIAGENSKGELVDITPCRILQTIYDRICR